MWAGQYRRRRCTGSRQCSRCKRDPNAMPHGPYLAFVRRNPRTMRNETLHIGAPGNDKVDGSEIIANPQARQWMEDYLNEKWRGEDMPSRGHVVSRANEVFG